MSSILRKKIVGDFLEKMLGTNLAQLYADEYVDEKTRVFEFFALKSKRPRPSTFEFYENRLAELYREKHEKKELQKGRKLAEIRCHFFKKLALYELNELFYFNDDVFNVDPAKLRALYREAWDEKLIFLRNRELTPHPEQDVARVPIKFNKDVAETELEDVIEFYIKIFLVTHVNFDRLLPEEQRKYALRELIRLEKVGEGCTTVETIMPLDMARQLEEAFTKGLLPDIRSLAVTPINNSLIINSSTNKSESGLLSQQISRPSEDDISADELEWMVLQKWRRAKRIEALIRPWRRLRWLFSPSVDTSPLSHAISESDLRAYTSKALRRKSLSWRNDFFMSWILWPALTAVLLLLTLLPLKLLVPDLSIAGGLVTGVLLSISGGQVCAAIVSPIAAGAGGIGMGWAFGTALAAAIGRFGLTGALASAAIQQNMALAVVGGPLGLTAPFWRGSFSAGLIVAMLITVALAIAMAGYLMAQPKRADPIAAAKRLAGDHDGSGSTPVEGEKKVSTTIAAGLLGSMAGGGIGLTFGATTLFMALGLNPLWAFIVGFGLVGGTAFGAMVWRVQHRSPPEAVMFAAVFVLAASIIVYAAGVTGGLVGIIFLTLANAIFQALWFTTAHVVGSLSSPRAAIIATTLEGAVGFTAFVAARILLS